MPYEIAWNMLILSNDDAEALLPMRECVTALEAANGARPLSRPLSHEWERGV